MPTAKKTYIGNATRMSATQTTSTSTQSRTFFSPDSSGRPAEHTPQKGVKAVFTIADFSVAQIIAELRRRGFTGELSHTVTYKV